MGMLKPQPISNIEEGESRNAELIFIALICYSTFKIRYSIFIPNDHSLKDMFEKKGGFYYFVPLWKKFTHSRY